MEANSLTFRKNGSFKILQFTDVHYDNGCPEDQETTKLMEHIISEEHPDFIMLTGDVCTGAVNTANLPNALAPVINAGCPWSMVFGNHDAEFGEGYDELLKVLYKLPNSLMQNDTSAGFGKSNYFLPIYSTTNNVPWVLFAFDSNMYNSNPLIQGYDYIRLSQIAWYQNKNRELKSVHGNSNALSFFHIPLTEYNDVWNTETCYGEKNENVCCSKQNSGLFSAMLEEGNMKGVFVGHDHLNDYWGELHGIRLCYGRATGYNTYGDEKFLHGARIILLNENTDSFVTYIRLSDHTVIKEQPIHMSTCTTN